MVIYPKKNLGHALNIRYSSKNDCLEFVTYYGKIVNYITDNEGKNTSWQELNFELMDQIFLYSYQKGIIEWL